MPRNKPEYYDLLFSEPLTSEEVIALRGKIQCITDKDAEKFLDFQNYPIVMPVKTFKTGVMICMSIDITIPTTIYRTGYDPIPNHTNFFIRI